ncbi:4,5-DOPA dioxygenase extradiol [Hydrogenophaga sp. 5NK40-0174]|uniref:4,5-DOPA-extradiol-dioxygenase n=1 Tax=Hydrogenophaga sp. 5NK40-0174 TaxID=3127649 RepID=UPI0033400734
MSWEEWPSSPRMPVLFLGHGSPMNAIEDNAWRRSWQAMGQRLLGAPARPRLILCVSAHWMTMGWQLTAMEQPRTIHDFYGFPQSLFDQQYPAPGAPGLAADISAGVTQPDSGKPLVLDDLEWGLDHGAWSVLKPMFPAADIPVIQLSIDLNRPASEHFALGRQLAALRDKGVLIIGSGNVVHNLRALQRQAADNQAYDWARAFDDWVASRVDSGNLADLGKAQQQGETARLSHPSWDHFLPLATVAGAIDADQDKPQMFNTGFQLASISMRSVIWGA